METAQNIDGLLRAAVAQHEAGQLAEAERLYAEVLQQEARNPVALNLMGVLAAQIGRTDKALELVRAAILEQPQNQHFRFNHAHILELAGDSAAITAYREALTIDPFHVPALINLGNLLIGADRHDEALDCFNRAISADPGQAAGHEGLGVALQRRHQYEDALAAFQRALSLAPGSPEAVSNIGSLLVELGRPAEALPFLQQALATAPESGIATDLRTNYGVAQFDLGNLPEAVEALREAHRKDPGNARATATYALLLAAAGSQAEAASILDYDRLLTSRRITAVPDFADLASFNEALALRVLNHPSLMRDRPSKTTRHGAQTGELSTDNDPAMQTLMATIREAVETTLAKGAEGGHALAPGPLADWRLTAWATVLRHGGHQDPHLHPSGRLSGVYYVRVPQPTGPSEDPEQGYIEFGAGPARFGEIPTPRRRIQPREGLMVLFPSFLWHRTVPFEGDPERISIAFDVIPAG